MSTNPISTPSNPPMPPVDVIASGPSIPHIKRIQLFSSDDWEDFVLEWAQSLKDKYSRVDRCAGSGDQGRDVIAIEDRNDPQIWDNYQCKHYDHPLSPTDVWTELGKLAYYTSIEEFTLPRRYYFVAPFGLGTTLSKKLGDTTWFCSGLLKNWDKYCTRKIRPSTTIPLTTELRTHIEGLDFTIIDYVPPLDIIEQHSTTRWHAARFGGGLPRRPDVAPPPENPIASEANYLRKLFDAYSDHEGKTISNSSHIKDNNNLLGHYSDSRHEFYSAESLRSFSRDILPDGSFKKLQDEIHDGIRDELRTDHASGYQRLVAVVGRARSLRLTAHPLVPRMHTRDSGGICHQLANDRDDIEWVEK